LGLGYSARVALTWGPCHQELPDLIELDPASPANTDDDDVFSDLSLQIFLQPSASNFAPNSFDVYPFSKA